MSTRCCDLCQHNPGYDWTAIRIMRHGLYVDIIHTFCEPCWNVIGAAISNGVEDRRKELGVSESENNY